MSGGRSTVAARKGVAVRQGGDICSVSPEGHALTEQYYIECKHVRSLDLESFFLTGKGALAKFWRVALREAKRHKREPIIIARQNRIKDLIITRPGSLKKVIVKNPSGMCLRIKSAGVVAEVRYLDDLLKSPFKADA